MKKRVFCIFALLLAFVLVLSSCQEGPKGDTGPAGPKGEKGETGEAGSSAYEPGLPGSGEEHPE